MKHADYALLFKALSDETRLKIVEMLSCGEMCACDILESFAISQPTLSYHMKILTDSGLINSRKDGSWMKYRISAEKAEAIKSFWEKITTDRQDCICKNGDNTSHCDG